MRSNLTNMICLDLYLSSLNKDKYLEVKSLLKTSTKRNINLLSWGTQNLFKENTVSKDINSIEILTNNFKWKNEISEILNKNSYESLVVTNINKKIVWVSDGFKKMTGYTKDFALDKTPDFLQGKKTSEATKSKIRKTLLKNKPFKGIILNYRKDKSTYKCELKIFPLFSKTNPTHFLALEREVV